MGRVLADDGGVKVKGFFVVGGKRTQDTTMAELDLVTSLVAEERLRELRKGIHAARFVKKYGVRLLPELHNRLNPMPL
jgi:hypothetical protein